MGIRRVEAAVADAGPLIHLAEIDTLSLLRIFERLYIPQAVWSETVDQDRVAQTNLLELDNIEKQPVPRVEVDQFIKVS